MSGLTHSIKLWFSHRQKCSWYLFCWINLILHKEVLSFQLENSTDASVWHSKYNDATPQLCLTAFVFCILLPLGLFSFTPSHIFPTFWHRNHICCHKPLQIKRKNEYMFALVDDWCSISLLLLLRKNGLRFSNRRNSNGTSALNCQFGQLFSARNTSLPSVRCGSHSAC